MSIHLTPEQEERIQVMIRTGAWQNVEDVVDAALTAVEHSAQPAFDDAIEVLESLLMEGLSSPELSDREFWLSVDEMTGAMLAEHKTSSRP